MLTVVERARGINHARRSNRIKCQSNSLFSRSYRLTQTIETLKTTTRCESLVVASLMTKTCSATSRRVRSQAKPLPQWYMRRYSRAHGTTLSRGVAMIQLHLRFKRQGNMQVVGLLMRSLWAMGQKREARWWIPPLSSTRRCTDAKIRTES